MIFLFFQLLSAAASFRFRFSEYFNEGFNPVTRKDHCKLTKTKSKHGMEKGSRKMMNLVVGYCVYCVYKS